MELKNVVERINSKNPGQWFTVQWSKTTEAGPYTVIANYSSQFRAKIHYTHIASVKSKGVTEGSSKLAWGTYHVDYKFIIQHTPKATKKNPTPKLNNYLRLYKGPNKPHVTYSIKGLAPSNPDLAIKISKSDLEALKILPNSFFKVSPETEVYTLNIDNITNIL